MTTLEQQFNDIVEFVKQWDNGKQATNDEKLEAYKYYKQATIGDINTSKPGIFSYTDRAKWNAWDSVKGMSSYDAKLKYIEVINEQKNKYN